MPLQESHFPIKSHCHLWVLPSVTTNGLPVCLSVKTIRHDGSMDLQKELIRYGNWGTLNEKLHNAVGHVCVK